MAEIETGKEKLQEMTERIGREITELFESGEFSEEEIRSAALGIIAQLADSLQKMPAERQVETVREPADNGRTNRIDSLVSETIERAEAEIAFLPDSLVGMSEMQEYGYLWEQILPLTKETAIELFEQDLPLLMLYPDNRSDVVENKEALMEHGGLFGIERSDWEDYLAEQNREQSLEESRGSGEEQLLYGSQDRYGIYQLKDMPEARDYRFMGKDYLDRNGIEVSKENYNLVYSAPLEEGMTLDGIYEKFNIDHPADFTGHSLSVSDMVVLHQNGEITSHYVDSFGFQEIPDFTKEREAVTGEKEQGRDKISYYVIEDLSTWANNGAERSALERFDRLSDAMEKFSEYQGQEWDYSDGTAKTTLGMAIGMAEFDILHVRENENYLVQDFMQIGAAEGNQEFLADLQTIHDTIGFDKIRLTREMTPEEVKGFVKERFEHQMRNGGLADISTYMERFDSLYEQNRMDNLMPTANQRRITEVVPVAEWENPYVALREPEELAVSIADRYISIQTCTDGYDYSIYDEGYRLLDGGIYDNPDISIREALHEIITDVKETMLDSQAGAYFQEDEAAAIDYDELQEKVEQREQEEIAERVGNRTEQESVVEAFRAKTLEHFKPLGNQALDDVEKTAYAHIQSVIDANKLDASVVDVVVSGSRCRGLERAGSDLDIVVEYKGSIREDDLFSALNEDGLMIAGVKVDINPITEERTGTLETYLPAVERYLAEKQEAVRESATTEEIPSEPKETVTLTVAECGEFHNLGEYHEGVESIREAVEIFNRIPPERMNGIPSIGIHIHTQGTEDYKDVQLDILSGKTIDLEILEYVPEIKNNDRAMELIAELVEKMPGREVLGTFPEHSAFQEKAAGILAAAIDQFSYEYDPHQYHDTVEDRLAQVENITEDIASGNSSYLNDFLQGIIDDDGLEEDVRRATELLKRLEDYKPLAKVEELEEANYNMIDNVLNNEKLKKEQERPEGRISVKEKLAEKRAELAQPGRQPAKEKNAKEAEKKQEREV